jgi:hypothetical protein
MFGYFLTHDDVTVVSVVNELNWVVFIIVYDRGKREKKENHQCK